LKDRFWFDINYIQNCVNYEFFPKLSKFKGFEKYANAKLEFKVWTQTPNTAVPNANANVVSTQKKKALSIKAFDFASLLAEFWAIFEIIIGNIYENKPITNEKKDLFNKTLNTLKTSIKEGFNELQIKPNPELAKKINENLNLFSQAKTNENLLKLNQALLDSKGDRVPFAKFKEIAKELNQTYNLTYLETEYNLAFTSAQMAAKWQTFEKSKDKYDLRYVAVNDKRTREDHRSLNGIVRPVDDPFWDSYYPPNGYRCRCTVERVLKGTEGRQVSELPEVPKIFNTNVGKTGIVFPEKYAYLTS
jgi:SPP1 gp7 family putative phage head morphogenesis protein